ncbi:nephrin-like [Liolophura sinensis]|uniref:nephrin-like n=1 Tax=Liolophura sinensis TaxID=3198878 RepID=UPI003157F46A
MVTRVTLTNPPHTVLAGQPTNFTCVPWASKPQACVRSYIRRSGNVREIDPRDCNRNSSSVQTTTRTFTFTATAEENGAELYCDASNSVTDPPVRSQVYTLNVQYPPQIGVSVSGYVNNTAVESGQQVTLTCQVGKGNPQTTLAWSSGCGQTNTVPGNDGSQQINSSITVGPSQNQKTCVCKGSQNGTLSRWTGQKSITFNVLFGPDSIQLRADSGQSGNTVTVTENTNVTFTCNASESNPAAVLSWKNNSSPISAAEISEVSSPPGHNHGCLTTQRYKVRVDRLQDGDVIRCGARRSGIRSSKRVSSNLTLDVRYEPMFTSCNTSYIFVENVTAELSCTTWAKPEPTISWSRGAQPSNVSVTNHRYTSVVRFSKISRTDSGIYTVTANNSVGRGAERTVNVTVYYAPNVSVVLVSEENVTEGNPLQLECRAEAAPQNYTYSSWSRTIGDHLLPLTNNSHEKSLSLSNVTFRDLGVYRCGASNGFGDVQWGQLEIKVRARPQFPEQINRQAAALGESIKLMFKFVSYPAYVSLTWYKVINGTAEKLTVSNSSGSKYRSRVTDANHEFLFNKAKVQLSGHVAELEISDVKRDDFGEYKFVAENDVGSSETIISLNLRDFLQTKEQKNPGALTVFLAGGLPGAIVLLAVVLLVVVIFRRRKQGSQSSGKTEQMRTNDVSNGVPSTRHYENVPGSRSSGETEQMRPDEVSNGEQSTRHYENVPGIGFPTNEQTTRAYEKVDLMPNSEEAARVYSELNTARKTSKAAKGKISVNTFANAAFAGDEVMYYNSGHDDRLETADQTR